MSPSVCVADAMALPLDVYNLIIYFLIGVCHSERGGAMSLTKTSVQWESCGCRTADVGE